MSRVATNPAPTIIDKFTAAQNGKTRFYTGRPCRRGHIVERFVSGGGCVECVNPRRVGIVDGDEFWYPRIKINQALDGALRNELEGLMQTWTDFVLTKKGLPIAQR